MKNLIIINNFNEYEEAVTTCMDFYNEEMEDSIFNLDLEEQKELAIRDDDYTELHSTLIDFIDHNFDFENNLNDKELLKCERFFGEDIGFDIDVAVTTAYKIALEMDL
jgi:hypothetical protein